MSAAGTPDPSAPRPPSLRPSRVSDDPAPDPWLPSAADRLPLRSVLGLARPVPRRKKTMVPADKKDADYWDRRLKNNEAARRSRERRRLRDLLLEKHLLSLGAENGRLRAQLGGLRRRLSLTVEASKSLIAPPPPLPFPQTGIWGYPRSVLAAGPTLGPLSVPWRGDSFDPGVGEPLWGTYTRVSPAFPHLPAPAAALKAGDTEGTKVDYPHVSSSDDAQFHPLFSTYRGARFGPDLLGRVPAFSPASLPAQFWLLPRLNHSIDGMLPRVCPHKDSVSPYVDPVSLYGYPASYSCSPGLSSI